MKKYIIFGILAILIVAGSVGVYLFNKKVPTLDNAKPDYVVTADDLFQSFEENEQEARSKYEGKIIEVTGIVSEVVNNQENANVILEAEMSMMGGVNCSFKQKLASEIDEGSSLTIRGECQGMLMDVVLNNCYLVE